MKRHWAGGFRVSGVLLITASLPGCGLADKDSKASDVQLLLNELLANGASDEADWIELKNIGDTAVDLSAFSLADSSDRWTFPALTADQAYARLPDGTGQFWTTLTLTPGAANQP